MINRKIFQIPPQLGLTSQIIIPMIAFLILMGGILFSGSFYLSQTTLENELTRDIEKTRSIIEFSLDNTLGDIKDDLIELSVSPAFKNAMADGDSDFIKQSLYNLISSKHGYFLDILELFKDGERWIDAGIVETPAIQFTEKHKNYLTTLPTWKHLSFKTGNTYQTVLVCAVPITNDQTGEINGVLYGGINLNSNTLFLDNLKKTSAAADAVLISQNKLLISANNPSSPTASGLVNWACKSSPGNFAIKNNTLFSTIQLLPDQAAPPLLFSFSRITPEFQSLKQNFMKIFGIMLILTIILSVAATWIMQKRILTALKKLTDYAYLVANGTSEASFIRGKIKEFNQLGNTLETMVSSIHEKSTYISKLFSSAKAPIINCDTEGKIIDMNISAENLLGNNHKELQNSNLKELFPTDYLPDINEYLALAASGYNPPLLEVPLMTKSEEEQIFTWTFSPVKMGTDDDSIFILLQGQNITENKNAIKKALESEARLRQIIDLLPQEIFANDIDGKFLLVNKNKAERLHNSADFITGKVLTDIISNSDDVSRIQEDNRRVLDRNEKLSLEESYIDKDRNIHWLETTKVPYTSAATKTQAILTISMDITRIKEAENSLQHINRELVDRVSMRTVELENANTALMKSMDELRQTQNKLVETEKMASLGELVAGIAHEVNTPLGIGVTGTSYLKEITENLQTQFSDNSLKKSDLEKYIATSSIALVNIVKNLDRAAKLISDFKQLAVDQSSDDLRDINLYDYIQGILISLKPKLNDHSHRLEVRCPKNLDITISPGSLMLVLSNLIINSVTHAFPDNDHGLIVIEAEKNGNGIIFNYSDNGIGMNDEQLLKIFDPFFTTKRSEGSTGLGMHLVYNLVTRALKGRIECKSSLGEGTSFEIWFPANSSDASGKVSP
ncbi:PAS domain S-box protein [Desulfovibrio gilichinskyi]|uniref:histidine kinase n=1 Tax=Desulfovibrio gilichinskyi TaxID=1519643 RepID=A0A1X7DF30_9BACT|nr:PAS domain S-box protein [Desulfovibrio gilichinskyi]SMF14254.1 two-component system, autoinducer 2 sensor kinase/phosphatase LuxQ [Desulfovibrio gilichinskyi]